MQLVGTNAHCELRGSWEIEKKTDQTVYGEREEEWLEAHPRVDGQMGKKVILPTTTTTTEGKSYFDSP